MSAFAVLGWSVGVNGDSTVESAAAEIASTIVAEWGVAEARAAVFGTEAVHFWDEAGVIKIGDDGSTIETGLRVLTELGAARLLASAAGAEDDIDRVLADDTLHDVAVLAAGMSSDVAAVVVDRAVALGSTDGLLVAARGCADGEPSVEVVVRLVDAVLTSAATEDDFVRLGIEISSLAVPPAVQADVLDGIARRLPDAEATVLCALAKAKWRTDGYQDGVLSALRTGPPPRTPNGARSIFIDDRPIKVAFDALAVECARTLDLDEAEVAEVLVEVTSAAALGLVRRIDRTTRGRGVALTLRERTVAIDYESFRKANDEIDRAFEDFLRMLAEWSPPRSLTWGECRRLNELARLCTALLISTSHPRDLDVAMEQSVDDLRLLVGAVIEAGSFDPARLAAEATEALAELAHAPKHDVSLLLMDSAGDDVALEWVLGNVDHLLELLGATRWIALVAATLLDGAPADMRADVAEQVATRAEVLGPWHRRLAGELAVRLDPSNTTIASWSSGEDALLRSVAAGAAAENDNTELLGELLADRDATVRFGGLIHVDPEAVATSDDLRAAVEAASSDAFELRTCRWCGTSNPPAGEPNCSQCGLALPDPRRAADALLKGRELSYEGEATQTVVAQL